MNTRVVLKIYVGGLWKQNTDTFHLIYVNIHIVSKLDCKCEH